MGAADETISDVALLARWRAGNNLAGSALVKRHFAALYRFFANKAEGDHEDLIQQTLMTCVQAKDAFRGESSFRAYLFGLARLQLLTHHRRVSRRAHVDFSTTSIRELGTSPTEPPARREKHALLQLALQHVPVDQQIALELTYWEGLDVPEVAAVLGVPADTVDSRLRSALEQLREALERLSDSDAEREGVLRLLAKS
jgi:RNA polymerase sigma-70 factor (ECF subfamily)